MSSDANLGFWEYNGKNGLQGAASTFEELPDGRVVTVKNPDNPAVLEDEFIAYCLRTSRQARNDFCRLFPALDAESQERLTTLISQNPRATALLRDSQDFHDAVQQSQVTGGVRPDAAGDTRQKQIAVENRVEVG